VDGAQTLGLLDVESDDIQPELLQRERAQMPCGPKETACPHINKSAQPKIWASIFKRLSGPRRVCRAPSRGSVSATVPAMIAFGEALTFQTKIGRGHIEKRSRDLTQG